MKIKTVLIIILAVIIVVLIVRAIFVFTPKKIVSVNDDITSLAINYQNLQVSANQSDIIEILSRYDAAASLADYFPYENKRIDFEINFICNHKPVHILLGEFNIWYGSADWFAHDIIGAEKLKSELKTALNIE